MKEAVFLLKVAIFVDIITQSPACTLRGFGGAYSMVFRRKVIVERTLENGDRSYFAMQADNRLCFIMEKSIR